MPPLLVAIAGVAIVLAIASAIITYRIVRSNRARQAERIQALQALASSPRREQERAVLAEPQVAHAEPQHVTLEIKRPLHTDEAAWDHAFRDEPILHAHRAPVPAPSSAPPLAPAVGTTAAAGSSPAAPVAPASPVAPAAPARAAKPAAARVAQSHVAASHPLFEETAAPSRSRAPLFAMAVLIIAFGGGVFYILSSGIIGRVVTASPARTAPPAASTVAAPVELLSLRHSNEPADAFVVTGLVQNPSAGAALRGVFAMVYLFDAEGRYFASSRAALDATTLSAGGQSAFTVRVPATTNVTKYRVSFQLEDGAAVNHVDRRGTLPDGTTGDAIETPARMPDRRK